MRAPTLPWQVYAIGAGVGAVLVGGYLLKRKLEGVTLGGVANAVASVVSPSATNSANNAAAAAVSALAYNARYSMAQLASKGLTDGVYAQAFNLRAYLAATGPLTTSGHIVQPDGSAVALTFNSSGAVTGSTVITPAPTPTNTGSVGGSW